MEKEELARDLGPREMKQDDEEWEEDDDLAGAVSEGYSGWVHEEL